MHFNSIYMTTPPPSATGVIFLYCSRHLHVAMIATFPGNFKFQKTEKTKQNKTNKQTNKKQTNKSIFLNQYPMQCLLSSIFTGVKSENTKELVVECRFSPLPSVTYPTTFTQCKVQLGFLHETKKWNIYCRDVNIKVDHTTGRGGKSPVGAYTKGTGWRRYSFFMFSKQFLSIIKKGWNVDLIDISSVWQFIWQQLTTISLVFHLSILRYFQFNEVSQG